MQRYGGIGCNPGYRALSLEQLVDPHAGVVELADTPDLGSGAARFGGSSPPSRILLSNTYVESGAGGPVALSPLTKAPEHREPYREA